MPAIWPSPPHSATDEAEESRSYRGSKLVASDDDGDGSDDGDN